MGLEWLLFEINPLLLGYETCGLYDEMVSKSNSRSYVMTFFIIFGAHMNILFIVKYYIIYNIIVINYEDFCAY
jgi:hypothetical protein